MDKYRNEIIEALKPIEQTIAEIKTGKAIPPHTTANMKDIGIQLQIYVLPPGKDHLDYSGEDH